MKKSVQIKLLPPKLEKTRATFYPPEHVVTNQEEDNREH